MAKYRIWKDSDGLYTISATLTVGNEVVATPRQAAVTRSQLPAAVKVVAARVNNVRKAYKDVRAATRLSPKGDNGKEVV